MRTRRVAAVLLALAGVLAPLRAPAADGRGCPAPNEAFKPSCRFVLRGTPITIYGESDATNAQVRVYVTLEGYPEIPPLLECSSSGSGFASCTRSYPDDTTAIDLTPHPLAPRFVARCHVEGRGTLAYSCVAGVEPV